MPTLKNLAPTTTNLGDRLVKNMRICGSGIYTYLASEAPSLHLDNVPSGMQYINVYRPPQVLTENKDKFARVPIITGRHVLVNRDNAKSLMVGCVGDTIESEVSEEDGETYLYATGTIVAGDGVEAYEQYGQLSCGYDPDIVWESGEHNGVPYQAVLKGFKDVNHLLICKMARGGPQCMVMDSIDTLTPMGRFVLNNGGRKMSIFSKIFGSQKKEITGDSSSVDLMLQSLEWGASPDKVIPKIMEMAGDAMDEEMKGFMEELKKADPKDPELPKAVQIVRDKWTSLNGDSEPEEKKCPECDKEPCECKEEKKEPVGDSEEKKEEPKEEKKEEKKEAPAGDSFDMDKFADLFMAKFGGALVDTLSKKVGVAGDTAPTGPKTGSDDILKGIYS